MSGAFRTLPRSQEAERPPRETTRLRLEELLPAGGAGGRGGGGGVTNRTGGDPLVAHLSAMTVTHGGLELLEAKVGAHWRRTGGALVVV